VEQRDIGTELEALRTLAAQVWGLVLDGVDGSSSLATSLSMVVELLEGWVDTVTTNGVRCGT
jgi:hypothetical protein